MSRMDEVLIVDDEPQIRELLKKSLERFGIRVRATEASTIKEAREAIHARKPRVVVLDWYLSDSLGTELAQEIADDPTLHSIRVLAISGVDQRGLNERFFRRGATEFLRKPFSPSEFVESVIRLLA